MFVLARIGLRFPGHSKCYTRSGCQLALHNFLLCQNSYPCCRILIFFNKDTVLIKISDKILKNRNYFIKLSIWNTMIVNIFCTNSITVWQVFALGTNCSGCLGIGDTQSSIEPRRLDTLCGKKLACLSYGSGPHVVAATTGMLCAFQCG